MRGRDLGWILILFALGASKPRKPSGGTRPRERVEPEESERPPNYNMSPEEQAERLPIDARELHAGRQYRFAGTVVSDVPVDTALLRRKMEFVGARNIQISERRPHRLRWTMRAPLSLKVQIGQVFSFDPELRIRLESVDEIASPEVQV